MILTLLGLLLTGAVDRVVCAGSALQCRNYGNDVLISYDAGVITGVNTGDQTKTCSAGQALTTLATGTSSTCSAFGTGSVTSVNVSTANGVSCVVTNPTTAADLTCSLGAITPFSVSASSPGGFTDTLDSYATTYWDHAGGPNNVIGTGVDPLNAVRIGANGNLTNITSCLAEIGKNYNSGASWTREACFRPNGNLEIVGALSATNLSGTSTGTNTGDQTKTCGAGTALTTLATGAGSTCSAFGQGTVTSVTGTAPIASSGGATPAISCAVASGSVAGCLSSTDWTTFNGKGSGTVTGVTGTAPIVSSGGTAPAISCTGAGAGVSGCLTDSAGVEALDAGLILTGPAALAVGFGGASTDGGLIGGYVSTSGLIPQGGNGSLGAGTVVKLGSYNSAYSGVWLGTSGTATPTSTNYALASNTAGTYVNGSSAINLSVSDTAKMTCNTGSCTFSSNTTVQSNVPSGTTAWDLLTGAYWCMGTATTGCISYNGTGTVSKTPATEYFYADPHLTGFFPGGILGNGVLIQQTRMTAPAYWTRLTGTILTAGTTATAQTFTYDVYDLTTTTVLCASVATLCNTAAGAAGLACTGTSVQADDVQIRMNDANCTTSPVMNIAAEYR